MDDLEEQLKGLSGFDTRRMMPEGIQVCGWKIRGLIGRGGSAEVYHVEGATGTSAALKILSKTDTSSLARFAREQDLLSKLSHPGIPKLLSAGDFNGHPYLIEELLESRDLPTTDRGCTTLMVKLCAVVSFLHCTGWVHRDLKPANILYRTNGEPVVVDFGLAKRMCGPELPTPASLVNGHPVGVGTPGYAAPEQLLGEGPSPEVDIHALGVIINQCFRGRSPAAWTKIIRRATSSLPGQRYRTALDLARAVRHRHFGRHVGLTLLGALVGATLTYRVLVALDTRQTEFPAILNLAGDTRTYADPVILTFGKTYFVTGPGGAERGSAGRSGIRPRPAARKIGPLSGQ